MQRLSDNKTKYVHSQTSNKTLKSILDAAKALAKARNKQAVTKDELFLATASSKKFNHNFPLDVVEKVLMVVDLYGAQNRDQVLLDESICRLLMGIEQVEKSANKQVELLVEWIRYIVQRNTDVDLIEQFRVENIQGVKQLTVQSRVLQHLHKIEMALHASVKGQDEAINKLQKQLAGWLLTPEHELTAPLKLIFCGPPSCGKRLLALTLAQSLKLDNGDPLPFMEFDLKGYCSHQNWESLVGHHSGYSNSREGALTGFVQKNPKCLILLSHIESAHENTIAALGPILLNGTAVDKYKDEQIDFSKCIIVVTTNVEPGAASNIDASLDAELAKNIVQFKELSHITLFSICRDALHEWKTFTEKKLKIKLEGISDSLACHLAATVMPDANVRNISDSAKNLLWEKVLEVFMQAIEVGNVLEEITINSPQLLELDDTSAPQDVAAKRLKRLAGSRRRIDFKTVNRQEGEKAIIELIDFSEQMVATPSDRGLILEGIPEDGMDSVVGHSEAIERLRTIAGLMHRPDNATVAVPRGILLHGAPGTGKTACARGFAAEAGLPIIRVSASDLLSPLNGGTAKNVRHAFTVTEKYKAPYAVLFIDEIDMLAKEREAITELLTCMQGVHDFSGVLVIGTTNQPELLDKALLRRFDMKITFDLPGPAEREKIIAWHLQGRNVADSIRLDMLARMAVGLSGAFLQDMVNDAARIALQRGETLIAESDLQAALENIIFGESSRRCSSTEDERRIIACHEAGHAVSLLHLSPETARDLAGISILTRNGIGGAVLREDNTNVMHIQKLVDIIAVLFGGIEAEKACLDVESAGCSSDLQNAASLAERLVLCFGYRMDGQITGNGQGYYPYVDESTKARAAEQVRLLLKEQRERSAALVTQHKEAVARIANVLMTEERLTAEQVGQLADYRDAA